MGIQALPDTTVRTLGATQALTDASTVVKELIDNSLDANATSISVETHSNTLDFIQVRDNGHGIAPEDRPLVARRYCTSKITHDDELKDIGGTSLGFRGEALASAAELSGSMTISTRVEGEMIAATLKIDRKGELISQEKASLPVGTTVRIGDFIKANPVRRQNALKNTDKCLKNIKRLLQAYAFARPNVRFSLRVAKSKKPISDWVYAPKPGGNAEDAAFKIVGAACASQCTWSVIEERGFTFQAFLPRPDAELGKVSNIGSFISVDARPVSSTAGSFKQIVKIFREELKNANSAFDGARDTFLYLNIDCPIGSYDVNLEPSKNDVLFEDNGRVIGAARKLFEAVYPKAESAPPPSARPNRELPAPERQESQPRSPQRHLEPQAIDEARIGDPRLEAAMEAIDTHEESETTDRPVRKFRSTMYGCDEEDLELLDERPPTGRTEAEYEELRQARKDITASNPWITAKLNSSLRRPVQAEGGEKTTNRQPSSSPTKQIPPPLNVEAVGLPTPRPSSPSPPLEDTGTRAATVARRPNSQMLRHEEATNARQTSPNGRRSRVADQEDDPNTAGFHPSDHVLNARFARDDRVAAYPDLPMPQRYTPMPSSDAVAIGREASDGFEGRTGPAYNYQLPPDETATTSGTPLDAIPDRRTRAALAPKQGVRGPVNKPFKPPLKDQAGTPGEKVWFDHLEGIERPRAQRRNHQNRPGNGLVSQGESADDIPRPLSPPQRNRDIRDFVGRGNGDSIAAMIERRNYGSRTPGEEQAEQEYMPNDAQQQQPRQAGVLGGRDFVPASDLAALEAFASSPEKQPRPAPNRRKTSERRPLRTMSANAPMADQEQPIRVNNPEDSDYAPKRQDLERRRSSNKLGRRKSSAKLPLERIPRDQRVHNLALTLSLSTQQLAQTFSGMDQEASIPGYNEPTVPVPCVFDSEGLGLEELSKNLHNFLIAIGSESRDTGPDIVFNELQAALLQREESLREEIDRDDPDDIMSNI